LRCEQPSTFIDVGTNAKLDLARIREKSKFCYSYEMTFILIIIYNEIIKIRYIEVVLQTVF